MDKKTLPEIEMTITSKEIKASTPKLAISWKTSDWTLWIDGKHKYAAWFNFKTDGRIDVDYDKAVLSCFYGDSEAAEELNKLLPDNE